MLLLGVKPSKLRVIGSSPAIDEYNHQVPTEDQLRPAGDEVLINLDWSIPEPYYSLDLAVYLVEKFDERRPRDYTPDEYRQALERVALELEQVEIFGMVEFMRTVIYVLDMLRAHDVVWGVGRGSSCASYLLFIIGLHAVDCVRFDVPYEEFYHS